MPINLIALTLVGPALLGLVALAAVDDIRRLRDQIRRNRAGGTDDSR